ncbi:MAG: hypothetical protein A2776_00560 [Candidatus Levybacteria bacterium RIFCSPHIGHO2_01_FULL_40_10]|nr:MAG: hypothetical protein A2776_00560 [Candidatus Levybacteria bacterium RIFCSPHIGHO2_01_FULL_40_10]
MILMKTFSYLVSPTAKKELEKVDITRAKMLLTLIAPKKEIRIRFESLVDVISSSLRLSGKSALEREIISVIKDKKETNLSTLITEIKKVHDFLRYFVYLSEEKIESRTVIQILDLLNAKKKIKQQKVEEIIDFLSINPDHAIVQAALLFILISRELPQDNDNIKISTILSKVFLYSQAYDFRGMINLEEFFLSDLINLEKKLKNAGEGDNLSEFIEFYIQALSIQAERSLVFIQKRSNGQETDVLTKLSERQIKIFSLFDIPDVKITNRIVQREFGVSQITASRDLAKLFTLGLIYQKGRGRSVYYVKT